MAATPNDARRATDDGYIWPVTRALMTTPAAILERMSEDIGVLLRERGLDATITTEDITRKGWSLAQVERHGAFAANNARVIAQREGRVMALNPTPWRTSPRHPRMILDALGDFVALAGSNDAASTIISRANAVAPLPHCNVPMSGTQIMGAFCAATLIGALQASLSDLITIARVFNVPEDQPELARAIALLGNPAEV